MTEPKGDFGERLETAEARIEEMAGVIEEVAKDIAKEEENPDKAPWWWPRLTRDEARNAWKRLVPWVEDVVRKRYVVMYAPDSESIGNCWFAHPGTLDDLSALYWVWRVSYSSKAGSSGPPEFIDRWLPHTLNRVNKVTHSCASKGLCTGWKEVMKTDVHPKRITAQDRDDFIAKDLAGRRPVRAVKDED